MYTLLSRKRELKASQNDVRACDFSLGSRVAIEVDLIATGPSRDPINPSPRRKLIELFLQVGAMLIDGRHYVRWLIEIFASRVNHISNFDGASAAEFVYIINMDYYLK